MLPRSPRHRPVPQQPALLHPVPQHSLTQPFSRRTRAAVLAMICLLSLLFAPASAGAVPEIRESGAGSGAASAKLPVPSRLDQECELSLDKRALPSNVELGETVEISLSIDASCPGGASGGPLDIVLAIDRSSTQFDNGTWEPTMRAAAVFLDMVDFDQAQVGIVSFGTDIGFGARDSALVRELSNDPAEVRAALDSIPDPPALGAWTNITAGINEAQAELTGPRSRAEAQAVMLLLSDGHHNAFLAGPPIPAATAAKSEGTLIVTIGLATDGAAENTMRQIASRPELYFPAPTGQDLEDAYREAAGSLLGAGQLTDLVITDFVTAEFAYVPGSASPAPDEESEGTLVWRVPVMQSEGWLATYRLETLVAGRHAANKLAYVDYLDPYAKPGSEIFPVPYVTVRKVGDLIKLFAPVAYNRGCKPGKPFDVVLAIDTSRSMDGEKIEATLAAARQFVGYLEMPSTRAAILAFNAEATVVQALSGDRSLALDALGRMPRSEGTRIDRALEVATEILADPGRDVGRLPVIVLLTDGNQVGTEQQAVFNAAAGARRVGATIFTIGFGDDIDPNLLIRVAADPDRFYAAPSGADLERIYLDIAGVLPCSG